MQSDFLLPPAADEYLAKIRQLREIIAPKMRENTPGAAIAELIAELQQRIGRIQTVSSALPLPTPPHIMGIYAPAVRELENTTSKELVDWAAAFWRLEKAEDMWRRNQILESKYLREQIPMITAPGGSLSDWGGDKPRVRPDMAKTAAQIDRVLLVALAQAAETVPPAATATVSPEQFLQQLQQQRDDAKERLARQTEIEWPRALQLLSDYSTHETLNILPVYAQQLSDILGEFYAAYRPLLDSSANMAAARVAVSARLVDVMDALSRVFESYQNEAPVIPLSEGIRGVPTRRDTSQLFNTPEGEQVVGLYRASRQLLDNARSKEWTFLSQIPRNVLLADLQPAVGAPPEPLGRLQRYMESRALLKTELNQSYNALKARK